MTNKKTIPLCEPSIGALEKDIVMRCLDSGWVSSVGAFVTEFEAAVAAQAGGNHGVATVNGTSALHIAMIVAGVKPGDEVLVSDLTFIAPVNAIHYIGAKPILVDSDLLYRQMDCDAVLSFLTDECERCGDQILNKQTGARIAAIVPVHILGHPVDIKRLISIADNFKIPVIEDATESIGSMVDDKPVGSFGLLSCFSFNGNKMMTTGGGGMIVTNDNKLADFARYLTNQAKDDPLEYTHEHVGYNYRLTNLQAALGMAQISRLSQFLAAKKAIAARYDRELAHIPGLQLPAVRPGVEDCRWLYTISIDADLYGMDSRALLRELMAFGIQTRPLWQPIHLNTPYRGVKRLGGDNAQFHYRRSLSIPCSVDLSDTDQLRVIETLAKLAER